MCIFSQPVVSVTDTNIFARLLPDGWQYVVYQMNFETQKRNAIILPLPVQLPATEESSLQFISLEQYGDFFSDLRKGFPLARPKTRSRSLGLDSPAANSAPKLAVHEVGDFIASFVPSIPDFTRLDQQFRVPKESWDKIPRYSDFSFAVFQLKSLRGKPHPMAFKFRSRLNSANGGSVFFPTVHIHDGEVHDREEFDHTLFLQAPEFDKACGEYKQSTRLIPDSATGYVRSKWPAGEFCNIAAGRGILDAESLVHRIEKKGRLKNVDIVANLDLSRSGDSTSLFSPIRILPAMAGIAGIVGLKWFTDRRDRISAERPS